MVHDATEITVWFFFCNNWAS